MLLEEKISGPTLQEHHKVVEWLCVGNEWKDEIVLHLERGSQNIYQLNEWIDGLVLWSVWYPVWKVFWKDIGTGQV